MTSLSHNRGLTGDMLMAMMADGCSPSVEDFGGKEADGEMGYSK